MPPTIWLPRSAQAFCICCICCIGSHAAAGDDAGIALPAAAAIIAGVNGIVIHGMAIAAADGAPTAGFGCGGARPGIEAAHWASSAGAPAACSIGAYDCAMLCSASLVIVAALAT